MTLDGVIIMRDMYFDWVQMAFGGDTSQWIKPSPFSTTMIVLRWPLVVILLNGLNLRLSQPLACQY